VGGASVAGLAPFSSSVTVGFAIRTQRRSQRPSRSAPSARIASSRSAARAASEAASKLYIYGYLNRIQSSRRLEREAQRNVEVMWLTGRLAPDFKTIADFRHDNGAGMLVGRTACVEVAAQCQ
jgi:hypothetical protein